MDAGAQSSHDTWSFTGNRKQWKEITHSMNQLECATKDKKNTWVKSCKESTTRKSEIKVLASDILGVEKFGPRDQQFSAQRI